MIVRELIEELLKCGLDLPVRISVGGKTHDSGGAGPAEEVEIEYIGNIEGKNIVWILGSED